MGVPGVPEKVAKVRATPGGEVGGISDQIFNATGSGAVWVAKFQGAEGWFQNFSGSYESTGCVCVVLRCSADP